MAQSRATQAVVIAGLLALAGTAAAEDWRRVASSDGVTIDVLEVDGIDVPAVRATTVVGAGVYEVAAALDDVRAACTWTARCAAARELKRISDTEKLFYTRTSAPWPLRDRDVVLHGRATGLALGSDVRVEFASVVSPLRPPIDGVVRLPRMRGHYRLLRVDEGHTRVELLIEADPGGWIPAVVARMASRVAPRETLVGLRRHLAKNRGRYAELARRIAPTPAAAEPAPAAP